MTSHVYEDVEAPAAFYLVAQWTSREGMESHLKGRTFGALLGAFEVLAARPSVQLVQLGEQGPQEALAAIRRIRTGGDAARLPHEGVVR